MLYFTKLRISLIHPDSQPNNRFLIGSYFFFADSLSFLGSPVIDRASGKSDVIPIIAGVLGAIAGIFLLGLVCFCFVHRKSRKESELDC